MDLEVATEHARWLQGLRQEIQVHREAVRRLNDGSRAPTQAEIQQLIHLNRSDYESFLFRYGKVAADFERKGFPGLSQELQAELQDIEGANRIYAQIEADRRRTEADLWAIRQETQNYVSRIQSEVYANRQRVYEEHNRRWAQAFRGSASPQFCSRCGRALDSYGRCVWCAW